MKRDSSSVIEDSGHKKKIARIRYEKKPETRFKRYVQSLNPVNQEKKVAYAKNPQVVDRRKILNQRRAANNRILLTLLKNEMLYDMSGRAYDLKGGIVCLPSEKQYFVISKSNELIKKPYTDDIELHQVIPVDTMITEQDTEFLELCQKFVDGDPDVIGLIRNKRAFTEVENPIMKNLDLLKKMVKHRLDDVSDTESSDGPEGQ
jgi:hypothetical protein